MPSSLFQPGRIFVDRAVQDLPETRRILRDLSHAPVEIPVTIIDDAKALKRPSPMTGAKKDLVLARMKADPLKEFRAMSVSSGRPYYSLDLVSNCHLECTYCILQSYLENNPVITIFTNREEILERLADQLARIPKGSVIGTGRIADSLALDDLTEHTRFLVPFFAGRPDVTLELKTKSDRIENLLNLNHGGRTVVGWSLSPPEIVEREEFKTASLEERLAAAGRVAAAGYPIAFHFDPIILHEGWKESYRQTLTRALEVVPAERIAWMSIGTLRFPARQARIMQKRFPKNDEILQGLISTQRTVIHYPDAVRGEMQSWMEGQALKALAKDQVYRCMDFE